MTYRAHWRPQGDGSPQQWENCGTDSTGMLADRDRKGVNPHHTVTPWLPPITKIVPYGWHSILPTMSSAIRNWINHNIPAAATTMGTTHGWGIQAARALYGITDLVYRWLATWSTFVSYLVAGRGQMVSIHYGSVLGTPYASSLAFAGRHRVYVNERRWNATLNRYDFLVYDPLAAHKASWQPQGPQWWPDWLLKRAMLAACGGAGVEVTASRDTEP